MTLTQIIYILLDSSSEITIPEIWAGLAPKGVDPTEGLLTFSPLPSGAVDFATGVTSEVYQFDIWSNDIFKSEEFRDELVKFLIGMAGVEAGKSLIFNLWQICLELRIIKLKNITIS